MGNMLKRTSNVSANKKKKQCLDIADLDMPDTLTMARWDRENQGPWEAEYSYGGEADLHRHHDNCDKNPGHKNFIPVDKFSIEDLPEGHSDPYIVDYIRVQSDLTVRVTVEYVSDRRPKTVPGSDKPYPGYGIRGQKRMAVGTGWVEQVYVYRDYLGPTCQCKDCRNSSTPETKFAVLYITTATHVVFDDLEAEHTTCHLFFDSGSTPATCSGVVTLTDMKSTYSDIQRDQCFIHHFTHDLHLGDRLRKTCILKESLKIKLSNTLPLITQYKRSMHVAEKQPLLFIVSHPHGCSKHISIGRWTSVSGAESAGFTFEYTTATCPGSSGAKVVMPHTFSPESINLDLRFVPGTHCGTSEERPGFNYFTTLYYTTMDHRPLDLYEAEHERVRRDMRIGRLFPIL